MPETLRKLTLKLYLFSFFDNFILIYPLYAVMFADYGLKSFQISSLFLVWSLTGFLFEIPAGVIADKYARKHVMLIGEVLKFLSLALWLVSKTYAGFMAGFVLWGIKIAINSGAREALVYDELKKINHLPSYTKVMGRMNSLILIGIIAAGLGASTLAHHGYNPILVLSMLAVLFSSAALLSLPTTRPIKSAHTMNYVGHLRQSLQEVLQKPVVLFLAVSIGAITGFSALEEYYGLFFREKGFSSGQIAFIIALVFIIGSLGGLIIHFLKASWRQIVTLLFIWALTLFAVTLLPRLLAPLVLGLFVMFYVGAEVLFNSFLQKELSDQTRATTTSVGGLLAEIFALITYALVTYGTHVSSYEYGFKLMAVGILITVIGLVIYAGRHWLELKKV